MILHPGLIAALEGVVRHRVVDHCRVVRLLVELEFAVGEPDQPTLGFRNVMTDAFRLHLAYLKSMGDISSSHNGRSNIPLRLLVIEKRRGSEK